MKRMVEVERFHAKTDNGKDYIIVHYQEYISVASHDDPHGEIKGLKRLVTSEGDTVNYINPTTFKIVSTDEIVHKIG